VYESVYEPGNIKSQSAAIACITRVDSVALIYDQKDVQVTEQLNDAKAEHYLGDEKSER
jgi:hypothetical protein